MDSILNDEKCYIAYCLSDFLFTANANGYTLENAYTTLDFATLDEVRNYLTGEYNQLKELPHFEELKKEVM